MGAYTNLESLQWLTEIDRYLTLRRNLGSQPSIGGPDGANRYLPHIFFVDSVHGSAAADGRTPDRAVTTVALAQAQCTAGRGDFIVCLPGHAETFAAAAALTLSVSGITLLGIGAGAMRPTFTWATSTAATVVVSGNNITIKNILTTSTIAALVKMFSVTGTNVTFDAVDYIEDGSTDCLQFILTTAAADYLTVKNCSWIRDTTAASATSAWIGLVGADYCKILDNYGTMKDTANNADGFIVGATTLSKSVEISRNTFMHAGSNAAISISMFTGTTGTIRWNHVASGKTAIAGQVACASCYAFENYVNNTVNTSGLLDPVVDS